MDEGHPLEPFGMSAPDETIARSDQPTTKGTGGARKAPPPVRVQLIRPDGTTREVTASGFFREEYLCALLDEELCSLPTNEKLVVHLFHPDPELVSSLRARWKEGLSDNRRVRIREVLGPNDDPRELAIQLQRIEARLKQGEKIHLAIRSPRVAKMASGSIRRILLSSQHGHLARLKVSVYGTEELQRAIMEHMEGMVRVQDYDRLLEAGVVAPIPSRISTGEKKRKRRRDARHLTPQEAVQRWIRKVEKKRSESS